MNKPNLVAVLIAFTLIFLVLLINGNPSLFYNLAIYIFMLIVSLVVYYIPDIKKNLIGISIDKSMIWSLVYAVGIGGGFYLLTKSVPGFSIGFPVLPATITEQLRSVIILFFAPVIETIFFQSVIFGVFITYTRNFNRRISYIIALVGQALIFSFSHVVSYATGFYDYKTIGEGLFSVSANASLFISAFIFALIGGFILTRKNINNLTFMIVLHFFMNLIVLTSLSVIFA